MTKQRILVIGHDTGLRATLARWLIGAGYSVELAENARRAREVLANEKIGLAIVAPERLDGGDFASELRTAVDRLILVSESLDEPSLTTGPAVQADGYLARPLREDDVIARINAVLRTEADVAEAVPEQLRFAGYILDAGSRNCFDASGNVVALTRAEFSLLLLLARRPGRVVSRDELTHAVAGRAAQRGDRSVDVLMSRLRRKIEADPKSPQMILTVPGVGYMLAAKCENTMHMAPASTPAAEETAPTVESKETGATAIAAPRPRPQKCPIRRRANDSSTPKPWRISPVSRSSF